MVALIIILAFLLLISAVMFLPIDAEISFKEELKFKIRFFGIRVFSLKNEIQKEEAPKVATEKTVKAKEENAALSYFKALKEKFGFLGAVKCILGFLKDLLPHIKGVLKHIKFKRIVLDITVAEDDAAKTAIEYGGICAVAYPLLAAIESIANVKYKAINISSDFEGKESEFCFSGVIRTRIFFLLIAAIKVYSEFKKFKARIENNERK